MLIRKLLKFENTHILRGCSRRRCSHSIHGYFYKVELLLSAHWLDNGQMIYEFGLLKGDVRELIAVFDFSVALRSDDDSGYLQAMRQYSERWVMIPVSPSAEQLSQLLFHLIDSALTLTNTVDGESGVRLHSVMVYETETGYAQCFREDTDNPDMGLIELKEIEFSPAIISDWFDPDLFERIKRGERNTNPMPI